MQLPNTRPSLSMLWNDTLIVTEWQEYEKPNGAVGTYEVITIAGEPCKLSFSSLSNTFANDAAAPVKQVIKLFFGKDLNIKAGSKISVLRDGKMFDYKQAGAPGVFGSHQEIVLIPYKDNA